MRKFWHAYVRLSIATLGFAIAVIGFSYVMLPTFIAGCVGWWSLWLIPIQILWFVVITFIGEKFDTNPLEEMKK